MNQFVRLCRGKPLEGFPSDGGQDAVDEVKKSRHVGEDLWEGKKTSVRFQVVDTIMDVWFWVRVARSFGFTCLLFDFSLKGCTWKHPASKSEKCNRRDLDSTSGTLEGLKQPELVGMTSKQNE